MIVVLSGGVGGSRFLQGMVRVVPPEEVVALVNTGDDEEFFGLSVSPDADIVTYALAGIVDEERGWGIQGDTFRWLEAMRRFGHDTWFAIGDRDLATHLYRTRRLREGTPLSRVAAELAGRLGVRARVLPMSDDRVRTVVETDDGPLPSSATWCSDTPATRYAASGWRAVSGHDRPRASWRRCGARRRSSSPPAIPSQASTRSWRCPACVRRCGRGGRAWPR